MKYEKAREYMLSGTNVTRLSAWTANQQLGILKKRQVDINDDIMSNFNINKNVDSYHTRHGDVMFVDETLYMINGPSVKLGYTLSQEDLEADDWATV